MFRPAPSTGTGPSGSRIHRHRTIRRRLLFVALGVVGLITACAPAAPGGSSSTGGVTKDINIGILAPSTGNGAASGKDMINGWNFYWQQHGSTLCNGQSTVHSFIEDTAGNPDTGRTKAKALVEQDHVQMIDGVLFANVGYAVAQYTESVGIPYFPAVSSADDLTQRQTNPLVLRIAGWTSSLPSHAFADWVMKNYPTQKKLVTIAPDYAFGYEYTGGFVNVATDNGVSLMKQFWPPLNTPDYSSYFSQIQSLNPDMVQATMVGADSIRFLKQWSTFGLSGKYPLYGSENLTDQSLLRSMGNEALGVITGAHFAEGRNDPATQDFVNAWDKQFNQLPSYYAAAMYTSAQWLAQSIESIGCNISNQTTFLNAVKSTKLTDSAFGPMSLDKYNNPVENVYIRQVEKRPDGRLWNVPIYTYNNVSQFWTYDPATYLQQPVYSKNFQGPNAKPTN